MKKLITITAILTALASLSFSQNFSKTEKAKNKDIEIGQDLLDRGYQKFAIPEDVDDELVIENTTDLLLQIDIFEQESKGMLGKIAEGTIGKHYEEEPEHCKTIKIKPGKTWADNPCSDDIDDMDFVYIKILSEEDFEIIDEGKVKDDLKLTIKRK
ncbi:hypothetical protein [Treponema sp.]|uniref:hypothetical protein n=1 Tax=Treponema sp. TaxID=166 RepID=UPI00298EBF3E|nr:hypothetical protein [Treponema sp.]MCQ2241728.1 hypothetical protein [Treponema sp.]